MVERSRVRLKSQRLVRVEVMSHYCMSPKVLPFY